MKKLTISLIFLAAASAFAEAPNLLTYQGRLKETGQAVTGNRSVDILLCDAEPSGSGNCFSSGAQNVYVSNGLFRSTFTVPAGANLDSGSWWLELKVGASTLSPRERLNSNAYALFAGTAAYASNISAAEGSNGVTISSNMFVSGNTFSVGGSTLVVTAGGVGINWVSPEAALQVSGGARFLPSSATSYILAAGPVSRPRALFVSSAGAVAMGEFQDVEIDTDSVLSIRPVMKTGAVALLGLSVYAQSDPASAVSPVSSDGDDSVLGGANFEGAMGGDDSIDMLLGLRAQTRRENAGAGVVKRAMAVLADQPYSDAGAGSVTDTFGIYIASQTTWNPGLQTNRPYALYSEDQNSGTYFAGRVGVGRARTDYALELSSAAGSAGNMLVISTGTSEVIRLTGGGEVHATSFHGDGSALTNLPAVGGDNLGNHTATQNLALGGFGITGAGQVVLSTITGPGSAYVYVNQNMALPASSLAIGNESSNAAFPLAVYGNSGALANVLQLENKTNSGGSGVRLYFSASGSGWGSIDVVDESAAGGSTSMRLSNFSGEQLRLHGPKVGIGSTAPDQKLTVGGNISQTGVLISSGTGDNYFAGKVGVGTASPDTGVKLHVSGGNIGLDNNTYLRWKNSGGGMSDVMWVGVDDKVNFRLPNPSSYTFQNSGGAALVSIMNSGKVGVGHADPAYQLDVLETIRAYTPSGGNGRIILGDGDINHGMTSAPTVDTFGQMTANSPTGGLNITGYSSAPGASGAFLGGVIGDANPTVTVPAVQIEGAKKNGITWQPLAAAETILGVRNNAGSNLLVVMGNGNVGIGNTAPGYKLHLLDSGSLSAAVESQAASTVQLFLKNTVASWGFIVDSIDSSKLKIALGGSPKMSFSGDDVGIGTVSPGYRLDVQGGYVNASGGLCIADNCKSSWASAGDNLGNHTATQDLNLAQFSAVNVASVTMVGKGLLIGTDLTASASGIFISTGGALQTTGIGYGPVAGNERGEGAVDLQTIRGAVTQVASGKYSAIGGGHYNTASGLYATVPGGSFNVASAPYSFAAGYGAKATAQGAFTWGDSQNGNPLDNNVQDRVVFKAQGGFLVTGSSNPALSGSVNRGVFVTGGGLLGISTGAPQAALDVVSTGTLVSQYAQIWRNSAGTIVASMTATGAFSPSLVDTPGDVRMSVSGSGLRIAEGSNARMGVATLAAGTVTVSNTSVTANTRIFLTMQGVAAGSPYVSARSPGVSFTITSTAGADAVDCAWLLIEP